MPGLVVIGRQITDKQRGGGGGHNVPPAFVCYLQLLSVLFSLLLNLSTAL